MSATTPEPVNGHNDFVDKVNGHDSQDDEDLFGDDDDDVQQHEDLNRKLDDSELDSGDDEARNDRLAATVEEDEDVVVDQRELKLLNTEVARVKYPEGDDLYLLNMPSFLGIKHRNFDPATYEAPSHPHDGRELSSDASSQFSPFNTAASTVHWRRDPKNPDLIQSNARIVRWSDGSLTLQIASTPKDQYRISTTALRQSFDHKNKARGSQQDYDPSKDTQNFLAVSHAVPGIDLQIIRPLDAALKIQPTGDIADESVLKLQQTLAAAVNQVHDPLATLKKVKEDPELAKRAAEMFEKDRMRTARKREAAEDRLLLRKDRVLGSRGLGSGRSGGVGLSVAGLEDDDGMPTARGTKSSMIKKRRSYNRRGDIYSDDEDENEPRRRTKEDEYDREDDFLASSDEEPATFEDDGQEEPEADEDDDPDVDDLEIEGRRTVIKSRTRGAERRDDRPDRGNRDRDRDRDRGGRGSTPKRALERSDNDDEGDTRRRGGSASGTEGVQTSPQARKKRRVIDEDDEDE